MNGMSFLRKIMDWFMSIFSMKKELESLSNAIKRNQGHLTIKVNEVNVNVLDIRDKISAMSDDIDVKTSFDNGVNEVLLKVSKCLIWSKDKDGRLKNISQEMKDRLLSLDLDLEWVTDMDLLKQYISKYDLIDNDKSIMKECLVDDDVLDNEDASISSLQGYLFGESVKINLYKHKIRAQDGKPIGMVGIIELRTTRDNIIRDIISGLLDERSTTGETVEAVVSTIEDTIEKQKA